MAHIKTIPFRDFILQELSDRATALNFLMAYFEEPIHEAEIIYAVETVASAQGIERRHANNLSCKIAEVQKLPPVARTLEHMSDLLKEAGYE